MANSKVSTPSIPAPAEKIPFQFTSQDALLLMTAILWGMNFAVAKAAVDILPPFVFNALRFSLGMTLTGLIMLRSGQSLTLPRHQWLPVIVAAFFANVIYQTFFIYGLQNTTVGNSVLILATGPVWVVLINVLRHQDRIGRGGVIGVGLALAGVLIVIISRYAGQLAIGSSTLLGDGLTFMAALMWAINILYTRRLLRTAPVTTVSFWIYVWGTAFQIILATPQLLRMNWAILNGDAIRAILYSGIGAVCLANLFWNRGLQKIGASRTAVYANLQPIVAAIAAIVFLHEAFTPWLVLGLIFVLLGLALVRRG